jgi:hypothetical protein
VSRRPASPRGAPSEAELAGFREGMARALAERRTEARPEPEGEAELARADRALARHRLDEAEAILTRIHGRLQASEREFEVTERPRGLVGYVAPGPADDPAPPEEDRLRNRILLGLRLATVRARSGADPTAPLEALAKAAAALARGERPEAERFVEVAFRAIEGPPPDPPRSR